MVKSKNKIIQKFKYAKLKYKEKKWHFRINKVIVIILNQKLEGNIL